MELTETQKRILNLIRQNAKITAIEMQEIIGLSEKEFYSAIRGLRTKGILTHVGLAKTGTWVIHLSN